MGKVNKKNEIRRNLIMSALLDHGELSLTELKNITGITLPIVMKIAGTLKKEQLIVEVNNKQPAQAGRPPSMVKINGEAGYILGVDIGRTFTKYILVDLAQNIVKDIRKETISLSNDPSVIDDLYKEVDDILQSCPVKWEKILGIGISLPGYVQGPIGRSQTYFNFGDKSTKEVMEAKFKKPVHIEHDAKAMALGEFWFGAAKNRTNVLCVNIGWGLGLAMIINGKLHYGMSNYAGEFGHLRIMPEGNLCYCGKRGCLETYASGKAIARIAKEKIKAGAQTILLSKYADNPEAIDAKVVIEAANEGDLFSIEIIEEAAEFLGLGIAQLINVFNPELVVFGGRITNAADLIMNPIISSAMKHSISKLHANVEFHVSKLGSKAGALGMTVLVARDLFETEHLNPIAYV
jgi:glucokinase-like ROK family protein